MSHVNIELKARCASPGTVRTTLLSQGARANGLDHQIDTYFHVRRGRLKLREGQIENALIYYEREDTPGPRQSNVSLYPSASKSVLKNILTRSLGILIVVEKYREIYFLENIKFHIDTVKELGSFVEIEAIDTDGTIGQERLWAQCRFFWDLLNIAQQDLVSASYSDLLLQRRQGIGR